MASYFVLLHNARRDLDEAWTRLRNTPQDWITEDEVRRLQEYVRDLEEIVERIS